MLILFPATCFHSLVLSLIVWFCNALSLIYTVQTYLFLKHITSTFSQKMKLNATSVFFVIATEKNVYGKNDQIWGQSKTSDVRLMLRGEKIAIILLHVKNKIESSHLWVFRETERHWKWESAQQKIEKEREKHSWFIFSETPQRKQHVIFLVIFMFAHTQTLINGKFSSRKYLKCHQSLSSQSTINAN